MSKLKQLTPEELELVSGSIEVVWNAIGFDVLDGSMDTSNAACIEACVDCDRLEEFDDRDGKAAHELIKCLYDARGYGSTLRYLAKHISLN